MGFYFFHIVKQLIAIACSYETIVMSVIVGINRGCLQARDGVKLLKDATHLTLKPAGTQTLCWNCSVLFLLDKPPLDRFVWIDSAFIVAVLPFLKHSSSSSGIVSGLSYVHGGVELP